MRLTAKRPGASTSFVDSQVEEALLKFSWKDDGSIDVAFHIYDACGQLVADSAGDRPLSAMVITADDGEVLLDIPAEATLPIRYRLRSQAGNLLTTSDGSRTQIFAFLRMESKGPPSYGGRTG